MAIHYLCIVKPEIFIVMKNILRIAVLVAIFALVPISQAQDTIDTTYYRYNFHRPPRFIDTAVGVVLPPMPPTLIDSLTGQEVIDQVTGEPVPACPNGLGFSNFYVSEGSTAYLVTDPWIPIFYPCKMNRQENTIYGLAVYLDHIADFTAGDSAMFILAERSHVTGRVTPFDTIVLKGGEVGISRHMEIPLMPSNVEGLRHSVHNSCIDTVKYARVMEFYLDTPHQLDGDSLYISPRFEREHHSRFYVAYFDEKYLTYNFSLTIFDESQWGEYWEEWGPTILEGQAFSTPIIAPLPEWEEGLFDTLIPMPTKPDNPDPGDPQNPDDPNDPYNPNNPNNPDDPNNPDNPQDPQNPEDPENPGGDEGIGRADAFGLTIYPNPASGYAVITSDSPIHELTLRDINGRLLLSLHNCGDSAKIDTSGLVPGMYMLRVTTDAGTATRKLAVR